MWVLFFVGVIVVFLFLKLFIPLINAGQNFAALLVGAIAGILFILIFILLVKEWKRIIGR
jgi:multisubunit Na+/H+ antiporter MnhB subunit